MQKKKKPTFDINALINYFRFIVPQVGTWIDEEHSMTYEYSLHDEKEREENIHNTKTVQGICKITGFVKDPYNDDGKVEIPRTPLDHSLPSRDRQIMQITLEYDISIEHKPKKVYGTYTLATESTKMLARVQLFAYMPGEDTSTYRGLFLKPYEAFLKDTNLKMELGNWLRDKKAEYDALYLDMMKGPDELRLPVDLNYSYPVAVQL